MHSVFFVTVVIFSFFHFLPSSLSLSFFFCLSFLLTLHFILPSISLLHEKRKELGDAASKLRNGLDKIDDTRAKVWSFVVQFYLTEHEIGFIFLWGNIVKYFSMEN